MMTPETASRDTPAPTAISPKSAAKSMRILTPRVSANSLRSKYIYCLSGSPWRPHTAPLTLRQGLAERIFLQRRPLRN